MNKPHSYFGTFVGRELTVDEATEVSGAGGGGVVLPIGTTTPTDTGTDNGVQCDYDTDWAGNIG